MHIHVHIIYIIILVFCVCVCLFVCLSPPRSLGTGGRDATLYAPTWRASPGELHNPLLESMRRAGGEKKALEVFPPLRVEAAVYPRKLIYKYSYSVCVCLFSQLHKPLLQSMRRAGGEIKVWKFFRHYVLKAVCPRKWGETGLLAETCSWTGFS